MFNCSVSVNEELIIINQDKAEARKTSKKQSQSEENAPRFSGCVHARVRSRVCASVCARVRTFEYTAKIKYKIKGAEHLLARTRRVPLCGDGGHLKARGAGRD